MALKPMEQLAEHVATFKYRVECHLNCLGDKSPSELEELLGVPMTGFKDPEEKTLYTRSDRERALLAWFDGVAPDLGVQIRNIGNSCEFGSSRLPAMNKLFVTELPPPLQQYLEAASPRTLTASANRIDSAALMFIAYMAAREAGLPKPDLKATVDDAIDWYIESHVHEPLNKAQRELSDKEVLELASMGVYLSELRAEYFA